MIHSQVAEVSARARAVFDQSFVWDMILPLDLQLGNPPTLLERYRASKVNAVSWTIAGDDAVTGETLHRIANARKYILSKPEEYVLLTRVEHIAQAKEQGKLAVGLHFEGTRVLERNLALIDAYYELGIRHSILAFNKSNSAGGGCAEKNDGGLTRFGELVVAEMNRVGMVLDLSHTGYKTTMDAMDVSSKPCFFSHSNITSVHNHFWNIKDEQIEACAKTGGVVGISGSTVYLGAETANAAALFKHVDYAVQLVGPQHVGIGLDLVGDAELALNWMHSRPDEWPAPPRTLEYAGPEVILPLTELMVSAGYSDADVAGIIGGNWIRVCKENWK